MTILSHVDRWPLLIISVEEGLQFHSRLYNPPPLLYTRLQLPEKRKLGKAALHSFQNLDAQSRAKVLHLLST